MKTFFEVKDTHFSKDEKDSSDLTLYACGMQETAPGTSYGPIVRSYHVIHFVKKGKGTVQISGRTYEVKAGEAFLLPAHVPHFYQSDAREPWTYTWISFLGLRAAAYFQMLQNASANHVVLRLHNIWMYTDKIENFVRQESISNLAGYFRGSALLAGILAQLFEELDISENPETAGRSVEEVKFFIDMNIGGTLKVKEIADVFGYHPNYLIRLFTETYGISPKQYIIDMKLQKARLLIEESSDSISLIAASLGFQDLATFSRAYKQHFGFSPTWSRLKRKSVEKE